LKTWKLIFFFPVVALAQAPGIEWQRLIGGGQNDGLNQFILTSDGGYLLTGGSSSNISGDKTLPLFGGNLSSGGDIWLVKLDQNRDIVWQAEYGGVGSTQNAMSDSGVTTLAVDGGFLVAGTSNTPISGNKTEYCRGGFDYWLIKTDNTGTPTWQKAYGSGTDDFLVDMVVCSDGNFVLAGYSNSYASGEKSEDTRGGTDGWIIKINPVGDILWQRTIGGSEEDRLYSARPTADGGLILSFTSASSISGEKSENSYGQNDIWIVKLNISGDIEWQKTIGGSSDDGAADAFPTSDGGYFVSGYSTSAISGLKTEPYYGSGDFWALKLDGQGNITWQKTIGGIYDDWVISSMEIDGKGFLLSGSTDSPVSGNKTVGTFGGQNDTWLVRLNETGDILWQKELGGSNIEFGFKMLPSDDGGIILGGSTYSSNSGSIDQVSNGAYDYWFLKLNPEELSTPTNTHAALSVWPNPTADAVNIRFPDFQDKISVSVYDAIGRMVFTQQFKNTDSINGLALGPASGLYLVKVESAGSEQSFKILKN
jgi:hypothetical protein